MRKCFACKQVIAWGDTSHPFPLDEKDRVVLNLDATHGVLYFHHNHYEAWLRQHVQNRKRVTVVGLPSWHRRE